jgi:Xaa-Pro dipeptidase
MIAKGLDGLYFAHVADLERRYAKVLSDEGWDAMCLHSGSLVRRSRFDDQFWPFRPCPHFQHWLPLAEPDCILVVRAGTRPALIRHASRSFWEEPPRPESTAFEDALDVIEMPDFAAAKEQLPRGRVAFVGEDPARAEEWGIGPHAACPADLVQALDALRTTKTPYEAECIAEANRRARAGHEALRDAFRGSDTSELDLHLLFLRETAQDDPETPYKNIVAFGRHAATLHHVAYGRQASGLDAESLLVDAGATCRGYGSDVTRTWLKGHGAAASAFAHILAGVEAMQQRLCSSVQVGVPYEALHDESHRQLASVLRDAGVVRASAEEAVATGVTRAFFPHGLGHSLGLQTHDVGCGLRVPRKENPFLRNTSTVAAGQVVTIEPGVYFIESLLGAVRADGRSRQVDWALVDELTPLGGMRIEDDVLVLEGGPRNFTREQLPIGGGRVG